MGLLTLLRPPTTSSVPLQVVLPSHPIATLYVVKESQVEVVLNKTPFGGNKMG